MDGDRELDLAAFLEPHSPPKKVAQQFPKLPFSSRNRTATQPLHGEKREGITHNPLSSLFLTKHFLNSSEERFQAAVLCA